MSVARTRAGTRPCLRPTVFRRGSSLSTRSPDRTPAQPDLWIRQAFRPASRSERPPFGSAGHPDARIPRRTIGRHSAIEDPGWALPGRLVCLLGINRPSASLSLPTAPLGGRSDRVRARRLASSNPSWNDASGFDSATGPDCAAVAGATGGCATGGCATGGCATGGCATGSTAARGLIAPRRGHRATRNPTRRPGVCRP